MIQQSINQMLGTVAAISRLSPSYENMSEAKNITKKGLAAQQGLKDIAQSIEAVKSGKKPEYSEAELKDISARVGEHVGNIGALKTAAIEGQPTSAFIKKDKAGRIKGLQSRSEYSKMLTGIENDLSAMREKAMENMKNKATSSINQDNEFKKLRQSILLGSSGEPLVVEA